MSSKTITLQYNLIEVVCLNIQYRPHQLTWVPEQPNLTLLRCMIDKKWLWKFYGQGQDLMKITTTHNYKVVNGNERTRILQTDRQTAASQKLLQGIRAVQKIAYRC